MKSRLLGLLKLLLQVVLFLLSGRWVRFGDERRDARRGAESQRQRGEQVPRPPARQRRRVFDARRRGPTPLSAARRERPARGREQGSLSDAAAPWAAPSQQDPYALRHAGERAHAQSTAFAVQSGSLGKARPRSLAATLRDRRALGESLAIGAALAPRRPPR